MRVGIITFHNAINYGAVLQAYALNRIINEEWADAEIIDYLNPQIINTYKPFNYGKSITLKNILKAISYYPFLKVKNYKFRRFVNKEICISKPYRTNDALKQISNKYEKFISGSDQIWNFQNTNNDNTYFLDFVNDKKKKYSYAASFGISEIPQKYKNIYKSLLMGFEKISVRESQGAKIVYDLTNRKSCINLDPTFLITKEMWLQLCKTEIHEKNYIVLYLMEYSLGIIQFAEKLSNELGLKIIYINSSLVNRVNGKYVRTAGPKRFLKLIAESSYVVTNSFHGLAFSIIFNKNFFIDFQERKQNSNSRIEELLSLFKLEDRLIYNSCSYKCDINYSNVNKILVMNRINSKNYLRDIIKDNK